MAVLVGVLVALEAVFLLFGLYLLLLTVAGLVRRARVHPPGRPSTRFAILVPAHNEELLLPRLLESLARVDYPRELYGVYVVADNCTDATAQVARQAGATVFQRRDSQRRGKGYALEWLLERVRALGPQHDAYLFLDADSVVSPGFLAAMDRSLRAGSQVVQGYYAVSNPTQSPVSALRAVALVLMHYVRPLGRQTLGLSCGLFGTGMAFRRQVLEGSGWDAFSLAEDVEYFLKLTARGVRVHFAPEAVLWAPMPASLKDATSQNLRWEKGRLQMAWRYGLPFLAQGLLRRDWARLDAGLEQIIPPLSVTFVVALLLLVVSLLVGNTWAVGLAVALNLSLAGHLLLGLLSARVSGGLYRALLYAPWFIMWKLWVYFQALLPGERSWTRTQRSQ